MSQERVLVVDDEPIVTEVVQRYLAREGYRVTVAADGESALKLARETGPDLIVLDLMLPKLDGLEVCRQLRAEYGVPIIMLSAKGEESDKILGLGLGADDYVTKPFSPRELTARVRALFRRLEVREAPDERIRVGDLEIDVPRMHVTVDGRSVELTPSEFRVLLTLAKEPGRVFTRGQLLDTLHGVAFESYERAIDAHVKNIRRKIEPDEGPPRYVQTVYGVGYRFAEGGP